MSSITIYVQYYQHSGIAQEVESLHITEDGALAATMSTGERCHFTNLRVVAITPTTFELKGLTRINSGFGIAPSDVHIVISR